MGRRSACAAFCEVHVYMNFARVACTRFSSSSLKVQGRSSPSSWRPSCFSVALCSSSWLQQALWLLPHCPAPARRVLDPVGPLASQRLALYWAWASPAPCTTSQPLCTRARPLPSIHQHRLRTTRRRRSTTSQPIAETVGGSTAGIGTVIATVIAGIGSASGATIAGIGTTETDEEGRQGVSVQTALAANPDPRPTRACA